jgi:electron transfer flavoprotein-quinone oxidoreductase
MSEKVDVVIVGAGLAGLACAYTLGESSLDVLVVERGEFPGAKNVSGGRLYLNPVRPHFPAGFFDDAPLERPVVKELLTMLAENASTTVELQSGALRTQPWHSATVLRGRLDRWLADRVQERGPLIIPRYRVDELALQDGRVTGIRAAGEEILADVTVLADGALSILAEQAGLRGKQDPHHFAVGFKEVIELPARTIEDRFGVAEGEGAAQLFFGSVSKGLFGGGFLYTNLKSVSLGMVLGIGGLAAAEPPVEAYLLLDELKARPEIAPLIAGGVPSEYSAHVIPEGGLAALPKLTGPGVLVAGDAAGLALNLGVTVRGMDFALISGVLAARSILQARQASDFSAGGLAGYEAALRDSVVLKDLTTFKDALKVLDNPRLFTRYPQAVCQIFQELMWIGEGPKSRLSSTAIREAWQGFGNLDTVRDGLGLLGI